MRILVCGGAGYIGSNMTAMLASSGHEPVVFDNLSKGHKTAIGGAQFIQGELVDYDLLVKTLKEERIEAVMHFAAFIEAGESVEKPLKYYHNNVCGTQMLLAAMENVGVNKFIFSSTAAVYGSPAQTPVTETSPTEPINPYGHTKLTIESMCHDQCQAGRLRYVALRYFNAAGAGFDCQLGEDHRPESHLIPLIIFAAMGKREKIKIFGTDYPTPDGTCIRDYIHISDLCRAHLLALKKLEQTNELICNLGNGKGYSVREVIDTVKAISKKDFKVIETERRPGDCAILISDATKAKNQLNWQPEIPQLEKIVEAAWRWHDKYPDGYPD